MKTALLAFFAASFVVVPLACDPDLTVQPPGVSVEPDASRDAVSTAPIDASPTDSATQEGGEAGPPSHLIDGTNDFSDGEKLPTTSSGTGYDAYVSWDATRIYFGMSGPDVGSNATNRWVLIYLEGDPGSGVGISYGGEQQPTLPFSAGYHLRWKANQTYTNAQSWNGAAWVDAVATVPVIAAAQGTFMEMSIARAAIGSPAKLKIHMNMLVEGGGADWTYAGVPSTSFVDGKNPAFTRYLDFDLNDTSKAPNTYVPAP